MKSLKKNGFLIVLILLLFAYVIVEWKRPKPVDWTESYINTDKIPYGTFALFSLLGESFRGQEIRATRMPPYNVLAEMTDTSDARIFNYLFVNDVFSPDRNDLKALLDFVRKGNQAFIAASTYDEAFADSVGIGLEYGLTGADSLVWLSNPRFGGKTYPMHENRPSAWFSRVDTSNTLRLAEGSSGKVHFIRVRFGEGSFYLHSRPLLFSNYYVLKNQGHEYAFGALSHLPPGPVLWDEYFKQGRSGSNSILYVIGRYPSLRWAWYLLLGGLLLFILFGGKRRQRVIPYMAPPANSSLEFAGVISSLYYHQDDFKSIAGKKIKHFREYLRKHYQEIPEDPLRERALVGKLAARAGYRQEALQELFQVIAYAEAAEQFSEAELHELNGKIEDFYEKTNRRPLQ